MTSPIAIDPIDLVLRVSATGVGGTEVPPNSNAGPFVEPRLALVGLKKGQPWCAADVSFTGHDALKERWPLPLTGGCVVLGEFAAAKKILFDTPAIGDVFLLWELVDGVWRFAHTGFCVKPAASPPAWITHEGNTSGAGSREGWMKAERTRTFGPKDRFVRWANLL